LLVIRRVIDLVVVSVGRRDAGLRADVGQHIRLRAFSLEGSLGDYLLRIVYSVQHCLA